MRRLRQRCHHRWQNGARSWSLLGLATRGGGVPGPLACRHTSTECRFRQVQSQVHRQGFADTRFSDTTSVRRMYEVVREEAAILHELRTSWRALGFEREGAINVVRDHMRNFTARGASKAARMQDHRCSGNMYARLAPTRRYLSWCHPGGHSRDHRLSLPKTLFRR